VNRLGWSILAIFVLVVIGIASMVHVSGRQLSSQHRSGSLAASSRVLRKPTSGTFVIPVVGVRLSALHDNWGEPRGGGTRAHHAIDIMAPRGTAVVAATGGRVEKLFESKPGGHTIYIRSPDGGTVTYYAHLDGYARGLREGMAVAQGTRIASVGSSGDADVAAPHLHFEVKRMARGEGWWQGTNVDPHPLLVGSHR
jgi:murein DD-endopeptidase MepM/ murein hydrolase activator NlpD